MPLYEYQCQACEACIEVIQRFDDAPLTACKECGGELKKLLSAPAFHLKGSGWYATDYAKAGSASKPASDSKKESTSSSSDSSDKAETKTASKKTSESPAAS